MKGGDMLVYAAGFPAVYGRQMPYFLDPIFKKRSAVDPPEVSDVFYKQEQEQVQCPIPNGSEEKQSEEPEQSKGSEEKPAEETAHA